MGFGRSACIVEMVVLVQPCGNELTRLHPQGWDMGHDVIFFIFLIYNCVSVLFFEAF